MGGLFPLARPALANGAAGVVMAARGRLPSIMAFAVRNKTIIAIGVLADPERLRTLDVSALEGGRGSAL